MRGGGGGDMDEGEVGGSGGGDTVRTGGGRGGKGGEVGTSAVGVYGEVRSTRGGLASGLSAPGASYTGERVRVGDCVGE